MLEKRLSWWSNVGAGCGTLMFRKMMNLAGLHADMYQHPLDRSSLSALRSVRGCSSIETVYGWEWWKAMRYQVRASIKCGEEQFQNCIPNWKMPVFEWVLTRFRLCLSQSPVVNASTFGAEDPVIVVHSALLDHLDDRGVCTVLGHELGHVHCEHSTYKLLATWSHGGMRLGMASTFSDTTPYGIAKMVALCRTDCRSSGITRITFARIQHSVLFEWQVDTVKESVGEQIWTLQPLWNKLVY